MRAQRARPQHGGLPLGDAVDPERRPAEEDGLLRVDPIKWRVAAAYCQLYSDPLSLNVSFTPGEQPGRSVSPIMFQATASLVPTQFTSTRLATRAYQMTVKASGSPATVNLGGAIAVGSIKEVFVVEFAVPVSDSCPNYDDNTLSIGNVRDIRSDVTPQNAATAGFINATVAPPV